MLGLECERWPVDCQPERRDESEREKELRCCKSLLPQASYKRTRPSTHACAPFPKIRCFLQDVVSSTLKNT